MHIFRCLILLVNVSRLPSFHENVNSLLHCHGGGVGPPVAGRLAVAFFYYSYNSLMCSRADCRTMTRSSARDRVGCHHIVVAAKRPQMVAVDCRCSTAGCALGFYALVDGCSWSMIRQRSACWSGSGHKSSDDYIY